VGGGKSADGGRLFPDGLPAAGSLLVEVGMPGVVRDPPEPRGDDVDVRHVREDRRLTVQVDLDRRDRLELQVIDVS
jgi:hypothetical protein